MRSTQFKLILKKKSLEIPRFFVSSQMIESEALKASNLIVENFFISYDSFIPKYSGFIKDLDLGIYILMKSKIWW